MPEERKPLDEMLKATLEAYKNLPEKTDADRRRIAELEQRLKETDSVPATYFSKRSQIKEGVYEYVESKNVHADLIAKGVYLYHVFDKSQPYFNNYGQEFQETRLAADFQGRFNRLKKKVIAEAAKLCRLLGYTGFFIDDRDISWEIDPPKEKLILDFISKTLPKADLKYCMNAVVEFYRRKK
jgi:hypothetical protein